MHLFIYLFAFVCTTDMSAFLSIIFLKLYFHIHCLKIHIISSIIQNSLILKETTLVIFSFLEVSNHNGEIHFPVQFWNNILMFRPISCLNLTCLILLAIGMYWNIKGHTWCFTYLHNIWCLISFYRLRTYFWDWITYRLLGAYHLVSFR